MTTMRTLTGPALLALTLAGCVHIAPAPVDPVVHASARIAMGFDSAATVDEARRIAPSAPVDMARPDRLALFAALLVHDPKIAEARRAITVAQKEAAATRKASAPTLTLTTEYANDPATRSPWLLGGSVDLPIDRGTRRSARLDKADLAVMAARFAYAETVWSERMALRRALIEGMAAAAQVPILTDLVALHDRRLAAMDARAARGEIAGLDLFPMRAQRAQAARALDEARARVARARVDVAGLFGVPVAALGSMAFAWPNFADPAPDAAAFTPADRASAIAARSDVLDALAAYDQTEADVRLEVARQAPAISIGPGYTWERGLVKLPLALNLALPSFDLNRSAIAAAVARRDKAGAAIETTLAGAAAAIESADADARAARAALARIRTTELPQTDAVATRADARLRQGAIDRSEWASARIAALEAQAAAVDALARVQQADAAREDALRRPLDGPETLIEPHLLEPHP